MAGRLMHPYRDNLGGRDSLTIREKLALGAKGFLKLEPILEQHRFVLHSDNGFCLDSRANAAVVVAGKDSTENLFAALKRETDPSLRSVLSAGFRRAFGTRMEKFKSDIHSSYSGVTAVSIRSERDRYNDAVAEQVRDLLSKDQMDRSVALDILEQVERNRRKI